MRAKIIILLLIFAGSLGISSSVQAAEEIRISETAVKELSADKFLVSAVLRNAYKSTREVTLRAQIFFFEKASPKGDKPAMILRKDETIVLRPQEVRKIHVKLINEGTRPKARLRLEPEVRLRREREWNY